LGADEGEEVVGAAADGLVLVACPRHLREARRGPPAAGAGSEDWEWMRTGPGGPSKPSWWPLAEWQCPPPTHSLTPSDVFHGVVGDGGASGRWGSASGGIS